MTDDIGLFGRWSWNDGKNEIMAFTDIDASLSIGTSIKGTRWGRPDDVIGLGGAINSLSRDHRDFIAAGGLGVLIGDGALNYRRERILETYYAYALNKALTLTADYQLITNPAYNADRGPVHVFSGQIPRGVLMKLGEGKFPPLSRRLILTCLVIINTALLRLLG